MYRFSYAEVLDHPPHCARQRERLAIEPLHDEVAAAVRQRWQLDGGNQFTRHDCRFDPGRLSALLVRQAQVDHCIHPARMQQGQPPDDHGTPIVADEGGILVSVVIEKCDEITRQVLDVIVGDVGRPRRAVRSRGAPDAQLRPGANRERPGRGQRVAGAAVVHEQLLAVLVPALDGDRRRVLAALPGDREVGDSDHADRGEDSEDEKRALVHAARSLYPRAAPGTSSPAP